MPRKRLTPANPLYLDAAPDPGILSEPARPRPPIADVAADASASASLRALSDSMAEARATGRMVVELQLSEITLDHLVRDRLASQDEDLDALVASIRERGQRTPVEVMSLKDGRYGLISGWRRCQAIARLAEAGHAAPVVLALLRQPSDASDAYRAMVEENEIRVGLSHFERARIVLRSVEAGVFDTEKAALQTMFRSASRAKRSKIGSFLGVVRALDGHLLHPSRLGERLGLALSHRLEADRGFALRLHEALQEVPDRDAETEQKLLKQALQGVIEPLKKRGKAVHPMSETRIGDGLVVRGTGGRIEITGTRADEDLRARLCAWLKQQG